DQIRAASGADMEEPSAMALAMQRALQQRPNWNTTTTQEQGNGNTQDESGRGLDGQHGEGADGRALLEGHEPFAQEVDESGRPRQNGAEYRQRNNQVGGEDGSQRGEVWPERGQIDDQGI